MLSMVEALDIALTRISFACLHKCNNSRETTDNIVRLFDLSESVLSPGSTTTAIVLSQAIMDIKSAYDT